MKNDPYMLLYRSQGVQTLFYESTPSPQGSLRNNTTNVKNMHPHRDSKISQGPTEDPGNVRANIPDASKEHDHRYTSGHYRVLFECIPGAHSIWRVASSIRFKTTERPHQRTSLSHAHY